MNDIVHLMCLEWYEMSVQCFMMLALNYQQFLI